MDKNFRETIKKNLTEGSVRLSEGIGCGLPGVVDDLGKCLAMLQAIEVAEAFGMMADDCSEAEDDTIIDVGEGIVSGFPTETEPEPGIREFEVSSLDDKIVSVVVDEPAVQVTT